VVGFLNDVFEAYGGIDRWRGLERFTVHFSINGARLASKGRRGALKELAAQGCTRTPSLIFTGFPAPDKCVAYLPERVVIETLGGVVLASRDNPRSAFRDHPDDAPWDDLHLAYYCGISIWNCLVAPFSLAEPDVKLEELAPWDERGETWRRLRAVFPGGTNSLNREQLFYFDRHGLQRRTDYAAIDAEGTLIAQYSWAHQAFSGIVVPTLHRGLILGPDGTVSRSPSHIDIEIFDVQFE